MTQGKQEWEKGSKKDTGRMTHDPGKTGVGEREKERHRTQDAGRREHRNGRKVVKKEDIRLKSNQQQATSTQHRANEHPATNILTFKTYKK